jgi:hypothetical protein
LQSEKEKQMPAVLPESKSEVTEDGLEALLPEPKIEEGEEFVDLAKAEDKPEPKQEVKAPAKPAPKEEEKQEETPQEEDVPAALKGKTPAQLAKMYRDAQALIGRQGQELGEYRRKVDQWLQADLAAKAEARRAATTPAKEEKPAEQDDVEFFAKPKEAIARAIAEHPMIKQISDTLGQAAKEREVSRATAATEKFNAAHPDASEIMQDPEFRKWVGASKVRTALLHRAHEKFDFDAGDEVFGTWKALKSVQKPATDVVDDAAAQAAAKTLAKRKEALKAAKTPTSGNASQEGTSGAKKIYRRADVIRLMEEDPERYEALAPEIERAYRDGRVR